MGKRDSVEEMEIRRNGLRAAFMRQSLNGIMKQSTGFILTEKGFSDLAFIHKQFFPDIPVPKSVEEMVEVLIHAQYAWVDIESGKLSRDTLSDEQITQLWRVLNVDSQYWYEHWTTTLEDLLYG